MHAPLSNEICVKCEERRGEGPIHPEKWIAHALCFFRVFPSQTVLLFCETFPEGPENAAESVEPEFPGVLRCGH